MAAVQETIDQVRKIDVDQYKYGFETKIETVKAPRGLSEDIVRFISEKKGEPAWMLEWRLEAYRRWVNMIEPTWANVTYPKIDFQNLYYYAAPKGTDEARLAVEVRNALLFSFTGGEAQAPPTHKLKIAISSTRTSVIVDINTSRPDIENYGMTATYTLTELATGKIVVTGQTFSRVSYDIPGQQQRYARLRGLRDAEDRAAKVIADNIRNRLASYFIAGT